MLVAGGRDSGGALASAEIYLPPESWSAADSLATARNDHTATRLEDGRVLVAGGAGPAASPPPAPRSTTRERQLERRRLARQGALAHTATLLDDGRVLVAGRILGRGHRQRRDLRPGERQLERSRLAHHCARRPHRDPARRRPGPRRGRGGHELPTDGERRDLRPGERQLERRRLPHHGAQVPHRDPARGRPGPGRGGISGGAASAGAEIYDPASDSWSAAGSLATARYHHTATPLADGRVLVAGGFSGGAASASAEIYDPASDDWSAAGSLATARSPTATPLADGRVLVAGGMGSGGAASASAEVYNAATGDWSATDSLATARSDHTATLLEDGRVLAAGGLSGGAALTATELYDYHGPAARLTPTTRGFGSQSIGVGPTAEQDLELENAGTAAARDRLDRARRRRPWRLRPRRLRLRRLRSGSARRDARRRRQLHRHGELRSSTTGDKRARLLVESDGGQDSSVLTGTGTEDPPSVLTAPTIPNGAAPVMGQRLDAARGGWTNQPTSYAFQWVRCNADGVTGCTDLVGATRNRYVPGAADVGEPWSCEWWRTTSSATAPRPRAYRPAWCSRRCPCCVRRRRCRRARRAWASRSGRAGAWYAGPTGYRYQWLRCDAAGDNCVAAAVERTSTRDVNPYVPTALDAGGTLRLRVVAVNQFGDSAPATTAPTGVVAHTAPEMLVAPRVPSGSPQVGVKVAGRSGSVDRSPDVLPLPVAALRCRGRQLRRGGRGAHEHPRLQQLRPHRARRDAHAAPARRGGQRAWGERTGHDRADRGRRRRYLRPGRAASSDDAARGSRRDCRWGGYGKADGSTDSRAEGSMRGHDQRWCGPARRCASRRVRRPGQRRGSTSS